MSYVVFILRRAQKELAKLPIETYERTKKAIRNLGEEPRPAGCQKLLGREGWRIRVGNYRIIYEIDDVQRIVTVILLPSTIVQRKVLTPCDFDSLAELEAHPVCLQYNLSN